MTNTTYLALLAAVSMTAPSHATDRPNGTTNDELVPRPERSDASKLFDSNRPEVEQALTIIQNTNTELNRIKEALRRIRATNPDVTTEQLATVRERLLQRARDLITNARKIGERTQDLRSRLGNRDELLAQTQEMRTTRHPPSKAATIRERE